MDCARNECSQTRRSSCSLLFLLSVELLPPARKSPKSPLSLVTRKRRSLDKTPLALVSSLIPTLLPVEFTPGIELSKVSCVSAELLAEEIVRLELLTKLSTRYKTIQSVTKRYIRYCSPSLLQYAILCRLTSLSQSPVFSVLLVRSQYCFFIRSS